ncbi:AraC family transcriptional regulator [Pseudomonas sp. PDM33]|uniref:AraC family transcriptional regulator n=1 Tax=Pseudomonas sp. PDM33 TaxID=2854765 RepID=UPI001C438DE5|nr:AraC family transcriptional regulator [Pseudomonas sp. PDM33]MBV7586249.1 AraC family transcriptional regulator [Pseudomonas sp. PDM33]
MNPNPFIRAIGLTGFEEFANAQGISAKGLLRDVSLPESLLSRPEGILSYRRYCALLELCRQRSGNPLFGLEFGLHQGINVFGELLFLIRNCETVGDALYELGNYFALYNGAAEIVLRVDGDLVTLDHHVKERHMPGLDQAEELACGVALELMRALVSKDWLPRAVLLRHSPLGDLSSYLRQLDIAPTFDTNVTGIQFDTSVLSVALNAANEHLHHLLAEHIRRMERLATGELPNYIRQLLRDLLPGGQATIEKVADCMILTPRTLQRRLAQEGITFQQILDDTRQTMAHSYLENPILSVAQIAELLGYADSSAFSRAFHRWFRTTPLEWQRQHCTKRQPLLLQKRRKS